MVPEEANEQQAVMPEEKKIMMNYSTDEIGARINEFLKEEFFADEPGTLDVQIGLLSEGFIDSVSVMILVEFLEKTFDFEFEPHEVDADNLDSIEKMVAFVQRKKV